MLILKTIVVIEELKGSTQRMDTIEHEGKFWLVPAWLDLPGEGVSMPDRLVPLDLLGATKSDGPDYQFVVPSPVPIAVFEGQTPPELMRRYGVVVRPDIRVPRRH